MYVAKAGLCCTGRKMLMSKCSSARAAEAVPKTSAAARMILDLADMLISPLVKVVAFRDSCDVSVSTFSSGGVRPFGMRSGVGEFCFTYQSQRRARSHGFCERLVTAAREPAAIFVRICSPGVAP